MTSTPEEPVGVAGLGPRTMAAIIDLAIMIALFVLMSIAFGQSESDTSEGFSLNINLSGGPFLLYLLLFYLYHFALEAFAGGTAGKKVMGLRVMKGASPADTGAIALRNLVRFIDFLPVLYLLGFVLVAAGSERKRLGDILAGTTVVKAT